MLSLRYDVLKILCLSFKSHNQNMIIHSKDVFGALGQRTIYTIVT